MKYKSLCTIFMVAILTHPKVTLASGYRLVEFQGSVEVKRRGQRDYRGATKDMALRLGDRLRTGNQAKARIQCPDLEQTWTMYSNLTRGVSAGCPNDDLSDLRGKLDDGAPGGDDSNIPYIISPRRTAVLDSTLTLRWNPVLGTNSYTVQLIGPDLHWETEVSNTEVNYPGTPLLRPAEDYRVIVESDLDSSSEEDSGTNIASFQLLHSRDVDLVQEKVTVLSQKNLSEEAYALALADIYIREDLLADAIDTLETLISNEVELFEVYQTLGDLYHHVGLNLLAETLYEKAITIGTINKQEKDLEGQSAVQARLAEVKLMLARPEKDAIELLTQAVAGYEAILAAYKAEVLNGEEVLDEDVKNKLEEEFQERIQDMKQRIQDLEK